MGTKLYIKTFGCQMNEYDSDKTVDILKEKKDVSVTDNPEDADIILLNTCKLEPIKLLPLPAFMSVT